MENVYSKILKLSEKYRNYTAQNLSQLIKAKSLSGDEKQVQLLLKKQMEEAGFDEVRGRWFR